MKKSTSIWATEKYNKPYKSSWKVLSNDDIFENINLKYTIEKTQKPWNCTLEHGMSMKSFY